MRVSGCDWVSSLLRGDTAWRGPDLVAFRVSFSIPSVRIKRGRLMLISPWISDLLFVARFDRSIRRFVGAFSSPFGLEKLTTSSSLKMFTSSIPGMVLTPILLSALCSFLSSFPLLLCTAFFFLHASVRPWSVSRLLLRLRFPPSHSSSPAHGSLSAGAHGTSHLLQLLEVHPRTRRASLSAALVGDTRSTTSVARLTCTSTRVTTLHNRSPDEGGEAADVRVREGYGKGYGTRWRVDQRRSATWTGISSIWVL